MPSTIIDVRTAASHAQVALALAATTGDEGLLAVALAFAAIVDFYLEQPIDRDRIARALALEQLER